MKDWGLLVACVTTLGFMTLASTSRVAIRLTNHALVCTVARDASNRRLEYGVEGHSYSEVPINGSDDIPTHSFPLPRMLPCIDADTLTAFCVLYWTPGGVARATAPLLCTP
jgi:hypothetical protein